MVLKKVIKIWQAFCGRVGCTFAKKKSFPVLCSWTGTSLEPPVCLWEPSRQTESCPTPRSYSSLKMSYLAAGWWFRANRCRSKHFRFSFLPPLPSPYSTEASHSCLFLFYFYTSFTTTAYFFCIYCYGLFKTLAQRTFMSLFILQLFMDFRLLQTSLLILQLYYLYNYHWIYFSSCRCQTGRTGTSVVSCTTWQHCKASWCHRVPPKIPFVFISSCQSNHTTKSGPAQLGMYLVNLIHFAR